MRSPFTARRTATTTATRPVPAPDVMAGMEYLEHPAGHRAGHDADRERALPQISVQGTDPQRISRALVPKVGLELEAGEARPDSVSELLGGAPGACTVGRLTFDVRPLRDVLEARVGWNLVARLVDSPSDRDVMASFRAALAEAAADNPLVETGDLDADVSIDGGAPGDPGGMRIAGRRHELGRARLSLTPFLVDSEQLTRRFAETLGRPRDGAGRRCLEDTLAALVADTPLVALLHAGGDAPRCAVPGSWSAGSDH